MDLVYLRSLKNNSIYFYHYEEDLEYIFVKNLCNSVELEKDIIIKLRQQEIPSILVKLDHSFTNHDLDNALGNGNIIIIYQNTSYLLPYAMIPKRSIQESIQDPTTLTSSKDSFNEVLPDQKALIKKRLKTSKLIFDDYKIGKKTCTDLSLVYLDDRKDDLVLSTIVNYLKNMDQELLSINDIMINFPQELVPLFETSGSPETICNALLKGRIVILCDNMPIGLIVPSSLFQFMEIENDVNNNPIHSVINRLIIMLFLFISVFFLGLFVVLTSHHPETLPTIFIANFQLSERGTTLPLFLELIIILILFEFYRIMMIRTSFSFIQNIIAIFGGIFIGQNAINASIIGSIAIIVASLSYVSGFGVTNNPKLITTFNIFRLYILIASHALGIIGFILSSINIICYLAKINIFNQCYLDPLIPLDFHKLKHWLIPRKD